MGKGDQGAHDLWDDPGVKQSQQNDEAEGFQLVIDPGQVPGEKVAEHLSEPVHVDADRAGIGESTVSGAVRLRRLLWLPIVDSYG